MGKNRSVWSNNRPKGHGEEKMGNITKEDYKKFKELLLIFVKHVNNDKELSAEPNCYYAEEDIKEHHKCGNTKFLDKYKLNNDFNKIAGLEFGMRFHYKKGNNPNTSIFINIERMNIIPEFNSNGEVEKLKNQYITKPYDEPKILKISSYVKGKMEILNVLCEWYSLEGLGLNESEPNENLKKFLNQYLEMYNSLQRYKALSPVKE
jgi:hypothetical protein